jgi:hypothetical protein
MRFVYPEFLWAFAALTVPVVIHLFNFRRYKTLYFSSLKFIKKVDQESKSTKNLKHYLVLASRILMLSSLILAFAQPYIPIKDNGSGGKNVIGIYIDNSFSMTAKGTEGELISESRETARKIIEKSSDDALFLICTNLMSGIEKQLISKVEALSYLDKIEPVGLTRSIPQIVEWQKQSIEQANQNDIKVGTIQLLYLSDYQKNTCNLNGLNSDSTNYYYPILLLAQENSNLYIDSVWFSSPVRKKGQVSELNFKVVNEGEIDLTNVEAQIAVGDLKKNIFLDIPAKSFIDSRISYTEKKEGNILGSISVNDKQLFWDDEFFFSYKIDKSGNVLVLNEENGDREVSKILNLEEYYKVSEKSIGELTSDLLNDKDLIVLNGVNSPSTGITTLLKDFIQGGGTVFLIPGKEAEFSSWNNLLSQLNLPMINGISNEGNKIREIMYKDRFFKGMFDKEKADISMNVLKKTFSVSKNAADVLITLQNGKPLLVKSKSNGTSYLLSTSTDDSFGSLKSTSLFPSILLRTAELSKRTSPLYVTLGEETVFPVYTKSQSERPLRLKNSNKEFIPRSETKGTVTYFSIGGIEATENLGPGHYSIFDENEIGILSINLNRDESKIDFFNQNEVSTLFENAGISNVSVKQIAEGQSSVDIEIDKPFEYWRLFVIFALVFLFAEIALLKFWK